MFHNSLRKFDFREEEDDNESYNHDKDVLIPESPGMEHIIENEQSKIKKIKPNKKFNQALETTKSLTDYLSMLENDAFLEQINVIKQLTELIRRGLPQEVIDVIGKHFQSSGNVFPETGESSLNIVSSNSSDTPGLYLKEIPLEHKVDTIGWK